LKVVFNHIFIFKLCFLENIMGDLITTLNAEKKSKQRLESLNGEVSKNQGKPILCFREFVTGITEGNMPVPHAYHVEAGVISGEVEDRGLVESIASMVCVDVSGGFLDSSQSSTYGYTPQIVIPVKKKLNRTTLFSLSLDFRLEDLEKCEEKGDMEFAGRELAYGEGREGRMDLSFTTERRPYLERLELIIGRKEIEGLMKEKACCRDADRFFRLLTQEGEIEKEIRGTYDIKRENLVKSLVQDVARLCMLDEKVQGIEADVLQAKMVLRSECGERWGEWSPDSSKAAVHLFEGHKGYGQEERNLLGVIRKKLEEGDKIELEEQPLFNFRVLGVLTSLSSKDYLSNLRDTFIPLIEGRLDKMEDYLRSGRKKGWK